MGKESTEGRSSATPVNLSHLQMLKTCEDDDVEMATWLADDDDMQCGWRVDALENNIQKIVTTYFPLPTFHVKMRGSLTTATAILANRYIYTDIEGDDIKNPPALAAGPLQSSPAFEENPRNILHTRRIVMETENQPSVKSQIFVINKFKKYLRKLVQQFATIAWNYSKLSATAFSVSFLCRFNIPN